MCLDSGNPTPSPKHRQSVHNLFRCSERCAVPGMETRLNLIFISHPPLISRDFTLSSLPPFGVSCGRKKEDGSEKQGTREASIERGRG
ncbi:hypothetical protein FKM82_008953 [Ascaphus truei]